MIRQAFDRDELNGYVHALRQEFDAPEIQNLPDVHGELASSGGRTHDEVPYLSRDPVQSMLQSTLETKLREQGVRDETPEHRDLLSRIVHTVESLLHPARYGHTDPEWVIDIGKSMLERLRRGNHPFNPEPARHQITDDARLVVVGDWGTGLPRARAVAACMAEEVADALAHGRQAHVVHLGDVYYSGTPEEVKRNVLAPGLWPVTTEQAGAGVTSWSLNGNHDMYGGGFGYFETLLGDPRFAVQHSADGKPTSFFCLSSPSWDIVGLDTSWDRDAFSEGQVGVLEDPQAQFVHEVAGGHGRKLMLMSHHQLTSVYDKQDLGETLGRKLGPVLGGGRVTAWLWGHEHRCMGFAADQGVEYPRCIGHGGVPVLMPRAADEPVPAPGLWEERGYLEERGERWARFGFAVLDFNGTRIDVRYRDDTGAQTRTETIA